MTSFLNHASEQLLKCEICTFDYDSEDRRPCVLVPCGHTLCKTCFDSIMESQKCPHDRQKIEKYVFNWDLIKLVLTNSASKQIVNRLDVLKQRIDELTTSSQRWQQLDDELKHAETRMKSMLKNRAQVRYFDARLGSLRCRLNTAREQTRMDESRLRSALSSSHSEIKANKLEQPRIIEMSIQLENEIKSVAGVMQRDDKAYRSSRHAIENIRMKMSSKSYLERLETTTATSPPQTLDAIELNESDCGDDDDSSSITNMGISELFETFNIRKKIFVILLMTVILPIVLSYPIATIIIAFLFYDKCLISPSIPKWLLIYGIFGLIIGILVIALIEYLYVTQKVRKSYIVLSILLTPLILSSLFQVAWFFYGNYLVFSVFARVDFSETAPRPNHNHCNSILYVFAFLAVIMPYIFTFIIIILFISVYFHSAATKLAAPPIEEIVI